MFALVLLFYTHFNFSRNEACLVEAGYVGNEGRRDDYKPCFIYMFTSACRAGGVNGADATNGTLAQLLLERLELERISIFTRMIDCGGVEARGKRGN
jgi:hypothetical protein